MAEVERIGDEEMPVLTVSTSKRESCLVVTARGCEGELTTVVLFLYNSYAIISVDMKRCFAKV